jgi:pimeloyl-ACP methyl ester carboxylesterase
MAELARTMAAAVGALGIQPYHLLGNSFGGRLALWLAVQFANRIQTLTLIAPAAIRLEGQPPLSPDERAKAMFAHPERLGPRPPEDPAVTAKQDALTRRLAGPPRDPELERRLAELAVPVLVLLGTEDRIVPKEVGRLYRELLPTSYVFFVYDAAHQVDVDRPEACAALIHDFVDRQEGFLVARRSGLLYP